MEKRLNITDLLAVRIALDDARKECRKRAEAEGLDPRIRACYERDASRYDALFLLVSEVKNRLLESGEDSVTVTLTVSLYEP